MVSVSLKPDQNQGGVNHIVILLCLLFVTTLFYYHEGQAATTNYLVSKQQKQLSTVGNTPQVPQQLNDCLTHINEVTEVKMYSQNGEDGGLLQTLRCMGHGNKEYFEFGSQDGMEVNTRILRDLYGWHGHLLDGFHENPSIPLHKEFFSPSNIVGLMQKYGVSKNLDVLSVDADYDDLYITREILLAGYKPRVLITEFNRSFDHQWSVSTVAKPLGKEDTIWWQNDCYFGASSLAMIRLARAFGYTPVWSNRTNLIFVRIDQALERNMLIPSPDNFPKPGVTSIHKGCPGRTWKVIDEETMNVRATDPTISHAQFASELPDVVLDFKEYHKGRWRIFYEVKA